MTARTREIVPDHPDAELVRDQNRFALGARLLAARTPARAFGLSDCGARLVGDFEGVYLAPYNDPVGLCTVGIGHLLHYSRCDSSEATLPSEAAAWALLRSDMAADYAPALAWVTVALTQPRADALLSFVYNVGTGAFHSSTLLRKLNAGDDGSVPSELMKWDKAGGHSLPGLTRRRQREGALFAHADYGWPCLPSVAQGPREDDEP